MLAEAERGDDATPRPDALGCPGSHRPSRRRFHPTVFLRRETDATVLAITDDAHALP